MTKKVFVIINTGTPDKAEVHYVRKFLSDFLNDRRVIDLQWLAGKILVNLIIVPFRAPESTKKYLKLWNENGFPLRYHLNNLVEKLQRRVGDEYLVSGAMRYGNPSLKDILQQIKRISPEQVIFFPLFPHYATSTTGSGNEFIMNQMTGWEVIPEVKFQGQFYSHPLYIDSVVSQIGKFDVSEYDHIVFSYHGLPLKQVQKNHPAIDCKSCTCEKEFPESCKLCYKAACYETTRLLSGKLGLESTTFSTSFQSRMSDGWLGPFTDDLLKELAVSGKRRVLVAAPSFAADCLETIVEIGEEYQELFRSSGGEKLDLVSSLNDDDKWVEAIIEIAGI